MNDPAPALPARLIQIVARFRPEADGVGEAALRVADVLWKDYGLPSDLVVCNSPRPGQALEVPPDFPHTVTRLDGAAPARLSLTLERLAQSSAPPPVVLLHFASYGYSRHGTPFWLARCLDRFVHGGGRLLTLFHELYASPRFPSKTLITSSLQRLVFRRVLALSDAAFTSSEIYLQKAELDNAKRRPLRLIGICSNAGEPENPRPLRLRKRRLSVFGRFSTRKRLYDLHLPFLQQVAQHLGIDEIADIGAVEDADWMHENVHNRLVTPVRSCGELSIEAASELLEDSVVGALSYHPLLLGKSSVFAAYQAHAMAILLFPEHARASAEDASAPPREPGCWALNAADLLALPARSAALEYRLQKAATGAYAQYRRHRSVRAMVDTLLPALRSNRSSR